MSKKSKQTTSVIGVMVFNMGGSAENTRIWCSECGDIVNNIEYQGDTANGKLKLGGVCRNCNERINLLQGNGFNFDLFQMTSDY